VVALVKGPDVLEVCRLAVPDGAECGRVHARSETLFDLRLWVVLHPLGGSADLVMARARHAGTSAIVMRPALIGMLLAEPAFVAGALLLPSRPKADRRAAVVRAWEARS
jgi:hypothetical protein